MLQRLRNTISTASMKAALRNRGPIRPGIHATGSAPRISGQGRIDLGEGFHCRSIDVRVHMEAEKGAAITIGEHGFVNSGTNLFAASDITIGDHCKIGDGCVLSDTGFHAVHQGHRVRPRPIRLGDNVWICRSVIIMPGVTIGDHSVIAAGSVVFDDVPARQIWRGNPAVFYKEVRAEDGFVRD